MMQPMPRTKRTTTITIDFDRTAVEYFKSRQARERFTAIENEYKGELMECLAAEGDEEVNGHRVLPTPPIQFTDAKGNTKTVSGIRRQRRESVGLNEERTLALLAQKGLLERCTTKITVINEDAVLAANFDERITDRELASLYDHNESFALVPIYEQ